MVDGIGRDLADIAAADPETIIGYLAILHDDDRLSPDDFLELTQVFAAEGVNLIRLLADHPEATRRQLGIDPGQLESHIEAFDP